MELRCSAIDFREPVAIVGAGNTGMRLFDLLTSEKCVVDLVVDSEESKQGKVFYNSGLEISSLSRLASFEGEILIACAGNIDLVSILSRLGVKSVNYFYNYEVNRLDFYCWRERREEIRELVSNVSDLDSKRALIAIEKAAITGQYIDAFNLTVPTPFFAPSLLQIKPGDILLDLGTYKGRHLNSLSLSDLSKLKKVVCVEPNPHNNSSLVNLFDHNANKAKLWRSKLEILNVAIKDRPGFGVNSEFGVSNRVQALTSSRNFNSVDSALRIVTLDFFRTLNPTLITIDIEGDELDLLQGQQDFFLETRPRIAISTYHQCNHLRYIYNFFNRLTSQTRFQFRLHDYGFMDQVLYADLQRA
jgi:FkbM family methyltransferase